MKGLKDESDFAIAEFSAPVFIEGAEVDRVEPDLTRAWLVETRQQAAHLLTLIEALPAAQREALLLHQEAGLTLEEIGEVTGARRETVKSRLRYALSTLREGMEGWL